jgi:hypothetical protein
MPLLPDPKSDAGFSIIKSWIDDCIERHETCGETKATPLPTRVIDISTRPEPFLLETQGAEGRFVALSYIWGNDQSRRPLRTTAQNLQSRHEEIKLSDFPQSFKDAIWITKQLGIDYIWIDALCIIQKSDIDEKDFIDPHHSDWAKESGEMGIYYGHAFLTISPLYCNNSHEPMLLPRKPEEVAILKNCNLKIGPYRKGWGPTFTDAPLNARAWVFQERLLSRRVLHFSKEIMLWECQTRARMEGDRGYTIPDSVGPMLLLTASQSEFESLKSTLASLKVDDALGVWRGIVALYSVRKLTLETDRLPALSGIAGFIQRRCGFTYMAGLWREDPLSLLWFYPRSPPYAKKCLEYVAPTWSWASIWEDFFFLEWSTRETDSKAAIAEINISTSPEALLGKVSPGSNIVVGGYTKTLKLDTTLQDEMDKLGLCVSLNDYTTGEQWGWARLDYEPGALEPGLQCVALCIVKSANPIRGFEFLLLRKSSNVDETVHAGKESWLRIGVGMSLWHVDSHPLGAFEGCSKQDMVLV